MVTNRPACIPIADLSGSRLRFGSKRMKSILTNMSPVQYRTHADETMVIPLKFGRSHSIMTPPTPIDQ